MAVVRSNRYIHVTDKVGDFVEVLSLSSLIQAAKRSVWKITTTQSTLILNLRGLFKEDPLMKNCGITLEKGRN